MSADSLMTAQRDKVVEHLMAPTTVIVDGEISFRTVVGDVHTVLRIETVQRPAPLPYLSRSYTNPEADDGDTVIRGTD